MNPILKQKIVSSHKKGNDAQMALSHICIRAYRKVCVVFKTEMIDFEVFSGRKKRKPNH